MYNEGSAQICPFGTGCGRLQRSDLDENLKNGITQSIGEKVYNLLSQTDAELIYHTSCIIEALQIDTNLFQSAFVELSYNANGKTGSLGEILTRLGGTPEQVAT